MEKAKGRVCVWPRRCQDSVLEAWLVLDSSRIANVQIASAMLLLTVPPPRGILGTSTVAEERKRRKWVEESQGEEERSI